MGWVTMLALLSIATIQWIRIVENCMECSALQVSITIVLDFPTLPFRFTYRYYFQFANRYDSNNSNMLMGLS